MVKEFHKPELITDYKEIDKIIQLYDNNIDSISFADKSRMILFIHETLYCITQTKNGNLIFKHKKKLITKDMPTQIDYNIPFENQSEEIKNIIFSNMNSENLQNELSEKEICLNGITRNMKEIYFINDIKVIKTYQYKTKPTDVDFHKGNFEVKILLEPIN